MSKQELEKASIPYFGKGVEVLFASTDGHFFYTEKVAKEYIRGKEFDVIKIDKPIKKAKK